MYPQLQPRVANYASVEAMPDGWHLKLKAASSKQYQLAQVDDYTGIARRDFPHTFPLTFQLRARVSSSGLPGTWGFGIWNDPFGFSLGFGASPWRLPETPNAAWFFFASPQNHLTFRDELPSAGLLAATFRSPRIPAALLAPAVLALPLLALRPASRRLRKLASKIIKQDAATVDINPTIWHDYKLVWKQDAVQFFVDGNDVFKTAVTPQAPLALVIWLDNQFAAWRPDGSLAYGVLPAQDSWLEVQDLRLN